MDVGQVGQAREALGVDGRSLPSLTCLLAPSAPSPARDKHFCLSCFPRARRAASLRARSSSSGTRALAGLSHLPDADWLDAHHSPMELSAHSFRQGGSLVAFPCGVFFESPEELKVTFDFYGKRMHSPGIFSLLPKS